MTEQEYLKKYGNPKTYDQDILRYQQGEPVQYIVGNVDFYGFPIQVNPSVLIPRFETEELVEKIIQKLKSKNFPLKIVDLGTGSGCIAIALKKHLNCDIDAVDISISALEVAKENAKQNHVNIRFYEGNFLDPLKETYDVIVSNPPYISYDEEIMELVKKNEPSIALYTDQNGLACYLEILKKAQIYLKPSGLIAFEIGYQQGDILKRISRSYFHDAKITVEKDLQGKDRYLFIQTK